jgi:hypothetical protein
MRYRFLFLFGILPFFMMSQNPLKKVLTGNGTSMHYSPSQFSFTNQTGATVFITDLKDRRSINWNKQVNDSVKIEAIGDYWNYPMNILFKNKINQDLTKANVNIDYSAQGDNIYKINPTLDVLYPNFVSYPEKGYWVLAKINMQVSKGPNVLFTKSYQEYTFFNKTINGYKEGFNSDLKEGANTAMWSSIKRLLDQFYTDLNDAFGGKTIQSSDIALNTIGASSIAGDANLNNQVSNYSGNKNTTETNPADNYKIDGDVPPPPPPVDAKLGNAVGVLGTEPKLNAEIKKPTTMPIIDSAKLAERRLREELRKKALDSAKKAKEELALTAKMMEKEEKERLQFKRDSILKVKKDAIALKVREKFVSDSIKKAEINKKIDEAKEITRKKRGELNPKPVEEKTASISKNEVSAVEKKKPQAIAKKPSKKVANESVGEAVRRIAREVEEEEDGRATALVTEEPTEVETPKTNKRTEEVAKVKAEREKALAEMKQKRAAKDSLLALEKQKKQDSLLAIRKAKAMEIEAAMARANAAKDSMAKILAAKRYVEDSIQLVREKERRREAVLAAQKAAMEAERNALIKNPTAGEMFPTVSTDPPSKLPDSRTREQVLADRIFAPKSETTKNLLARVKLITPEEEARLLAQMKTDDKSVSDSFFIQLQKNRPIPTYTPLDTTKPAAATKSGTPAKSSSIEDKKAQIIEKGLKGAKDAKDIKPTTDKIPAKIDTKKAADTAKKAAMDPIKSGMSTRKRTTSASNSDKAPVPPAVVETPKSEPAKVDTTSLEKKEKDLEMDIEKKKKEISDRLKKAKSW